jgi:hypothetical protein
LEKELKKPGNLQYAKNRKIILKLYNSWKKNSRNQGNIRKKIQEIANSKRRNFFYKRKK